MVNNLKIGIIKESKNPPDTRVVLSPNMCLELTQQYPQTKIIIQPSDSRCFKDYEYKALGFELNDNLTNCDILMGIKEVHIANLIPNKTYFMFSHTAKKQEHNRNLLKEIIKKKITLIDYEYLKDTEGKRIIAFGYWAGVVGTYKMLRARGIRTDHFYLKPGFECINFEDMLHQLKNIKLKPIKIVVTGAGRVAKGAVRILKELNLKYVYPEDYLNNEYNEAVYTVLSAKHYTKHKNGLNFSKQDFYQNPKNYKSNFKPYYQCSNIFLACHFWNQNSPYFFSKEEIRSKDFKISIIADISCDLNGPIPSTLRASSNADPFYGYNPITEQEEIAFTNPKNITVMSVDSLPGELPKDASNEFSNTFLNKIFPLLLEKDNEIINNATIVKNGVLTPKFSYLNDFINQESKV